LHADDHKHCHQMEESKPFTGMSSNTYIATPTPTYNASTYGTCVTSESWTDKDFIAARKAVQREFDHAHNLRMQKARKNCGRVKW